MRVCYDVCSAWTKGGRRKPFQASPPSVLAQSCLVQVMPMHALRKSRYQPITLSHPRSYIASSASYTHASSGAGPQGPSSSAPLDGTGSAVDNDAVTPQGGGGDGADSNQGGAGMTVEEIERALMEDSDGAER